MQAKVFSAPPTHPIYPVLHVLPTLKYVCSVPEITFSDLVTLTFDLDLYVDLRVIHVDALTKYNDPRCNTLRGHPSFSSLGQCKARPFNFVGVCLFFLYFFFSALTDYAFDALKAKLLYIESPNLSQGSTLRVMIEIIISVNDENNGRPLRDMKSDLNSLKSEILTRKRTYKP